MAPVTPGVAGADEDKRSEPQSLPHLTPPLCDEGEGGGGLRERKGVRVVEKEGGKRGWWVRGWG